MQLNECLCEKCERNNFLFVNNGSVTRDYLWRDGLHLSNDGAHIFACNLADFWNNFVFKRNIWLTKNNTENKKNKFNINGNNNSNNKDNKSCNDNISNSRNLKRCETDILSNLSIRNVKKLTIGDLNMNSISEKFGQLILLVAGKVDIIIITETRLDCTFPSSQFMANGCIESYRFARNKNGEGVLIYVRYTKVYEAKV